MRILTRDDDEVTLADSQKQTGSGSGSGAGKVDNHELKVDKLITQPTQSNEPPKLNLSALSTKELLSALDGLKPAQLKAIGEAAVSAGLAPPPKDVAEGVTLPDGRVRVTVFFDSDLGAQLKLWAEAQNETLAKFIEGALTSYVQMDWSSVGEAPALVAPK